MTILEEAHHSLIIIEHDPLIYEDSAEMVEYVSKAMRALPRRLPYSSTRLGWTPSWRSLPKRAITYSSSRKDQETRQGYWPSRARGLRTRSLWRRSLDIDALLKCRRVPCKWLNGTLWLSDKDFFPSDMIFAEIGLVDYAMRGTQDLSILVSSYHLIASQAKPADHDTGNKDF
jgi:hypothetical protein